MNHFCTISSSDFLFKVYALHQSLSSACSTTFTLHVLLTDETQQHDSASIKFYKLQDLKDKNAIQIQAKYKDDKLRWSMKPILLNFLLQTFPKVIYIDNDIAFYDCPDFLFEQLNKHVVLLTPHRYSFSPTKEQHWLENNLKFGLFNAGFVAVNQEAKSVLHWWAECCIYRCEKNFWRGLYDDQKYLDLFPIIEPSTKIIEHKGCNVAGWNIENCPRTQSNHQTLVGGFPILFIHFNYYTIRMILEGQDELLKPYWGKYFASMKQFKNQIQEKDFYEPLPLSDKLKLTLWNKI